jgi:hypothetical protein
MHDALRVESHGMTEDSAAGAGADGAAGAGSPRIVPDFGEYLALKAQIELLTARLEAMKPAIVEALALQGGRAVFGGYEFCVRSRVTYEYSAAVAAAEERLAELKRQEQQQGVARVRSYTEFPFVRAV